VFQASHNLVLRLLAEGKIAGVRVDHVDGLFDPKQYLERLQLYFLLGVAKKIVTERTDSQASDWNELAGPVEERFRELLNAGVVGNGVARPEQEGKMVGGADGATHAPRSSSGRAASGNANGADGVSVHERRGAGFLGEPAGLQEAHAPVALAEPPEPLT